MAEEERPGAGGEGERPDPDEPREELPEATELGDLPAAGEATEGAEPVPAELAAEPLAAEPPADELGSVPASGDLVAESPADVPAADEPVSAEPAAAEPPADVPAADDPVSAEAVADPGSTVPAAAESPAAPAPERPAEVRPRPQRAPDARPREERQEEEEVVPGAHLEPDLVLEEPVPPEERELAEFGEAGIAYAEPELEPEPEAPEAAPERVDGESAPGPVVATPRDLAADARYQATGKRKSAVARVIIKPGEGSYQVNGRSLEEFFPRVTLQKVARQPLETARYESRMDVVAKIHGGGVSAQAGALRHGVARALIEADPNLRGELKRRGFLTRDARVKERRKAGLKKARKRPQFSKR